MPPKTKKPAKPEPISKELQLQQEASRIQLTATAMVVDSPENYVTASEMVKAIKAEIKRREEYWEDDVARARAAHKGLCEKRDASITPLKAALDIVEPKRRDYERQEEARVEAERRAREKEERERAEAEQAARAKEAEEAGDKSAAEAIRAEPVILLPVPVAPAVPKIGGLGRRKNYGARCENLFELARAVVDGKENASAIVPNETYINGRARAEKEMFRMAGCKLLVTESSFSW